MLPEEFLSRMKDMLGSDYPGFRKSLDDEPFHGLRFNPNKGSLETFLSRAPFELKPVPWEKNGFYYDGSDTPGKHPYHSAGVYYIQEPSAMAPVVYLDPKPGETILDLCAAPGGKSTQIASAMANQGLLISNEIHPARARILSENIERMGVKNCLVTNESPDRLSSIFSDYFDRILVDAPCSGEGMFRKNPDACGEWSPDNVALCSDRQLEILSCAATMLKPGGRMVYSTCTFAPEENEGTIHRFLEEHPQFSIIEASPFPGMAKGNPDWIHAERMELCHSIRLFPHLLSGEGHFLCVLEKEGGPASKVRGFCAGGTEPAISSKDCREYLEFAGECLKNQPEGKLIRFGEQLYLAPDRLPRLKGMKVLRPGLHLGTIKKNRFEPSHALANALSEDEVALSCNLSSQSSEINAYLNGQTFSCEGEKGWYLITVDHYSTGWGKLTGSTMKNHYPKGLRINY